MKFLLLVILLLTGLLLFSQIQFVTDANGIRLYPVDDQLYPRDVNNEAIATIQGTITNPSLYDNIKLTITKEPYLGSISYSSTTLFVSGNSFSFSPTIEAGLYRYKFVLELIDNGTTLYTETIAEGVVCGDVYVVSGQSNAFAGIYPYYNEMTTQNTAYQNYNGKNYSKSIGKIGNWSTATNPDGFIDYDPDDNLWHPSTTAHNWNYKGYVGAWALKLQYLIAQEHQMPTCIINGARGATSIVNHQIDYNSSTNPMDMATLFGALNYRVNQANVKNDIKGIIWYQGESDSGTDANDYANELDDLITSWESEWSTVDKVYIVQIHTGCGTGGNARAIREVQRTFINHPDHDNIEIITANGIGDRLQSFEDNTLIDKCHFSRTAYNNLADRIFDIISRDFYCSNKMSGINSPNIQNAYFKSGQVVLEFDQILYDFPQDIEDYFSFVSSTGVEHVTPFTGGIIDKNKVILDYSGSTTNYISYLKETDPVPDPSKILWSDYATYWQMTWLKNMEGNAAFSFHKFPIGTNECTNNNYDQELCGTVSTSTIKDKYITNCNVDCGSGYTNINSGSDVELRAQNTVHFKPGFKAYSGSTVHAYISSPDNCTSDPVSRIGNFNSTEEVTEIIIDSKIVVYPNPFNGVVKIENINSSEELDIIIFNSLGKIIYHQKHIEQIKSIDLNNQPNGIYFIQINSSNQNITKKIIKQ